MSSPGAISPRIMHHAALEGIEDTILSVYTEVYAAQLSDPFDSVERFLGRLRSYASAPGWDCVIGTVAEGAAGLVYGYTLGPNANWWRGLVDAVDPALTEENGHRTFALCDIMVRVPWRKTGISRLLHDELIHPRPEERVTLLVDSRHPKVRKVYERWGYRRLGRLLPFPDAPLYDAMLLPLAA